MSEHVFSPGELAFYLVELKDQYEAAASWPVDGVAITAERYAQVRAEESQGRVLCADSNGQPITVERPPLSVEQLSVIERAWRDEQLAATDSLVARHRDEQEIGQTTLSAEQYLALQVYRRALRSWPQAEVFPEVVARPAAPPWLAEQIQ
ncbi:Phage tail protein [Pseudomonas donghuensis]|uniref:phage tail assembly chaperone n=1 Tax=Pseudomonas donghuensis TaxID=1163398 RepID=UPI0039DF91B6